MIFLILAVIATVTVFVLTGLLPLSLLAGGVFAAIAIAVFVTKSISAHQNMVSDVVKQDDYKDDPTDVFLHM